MSGKRVRVQMGQFGAPDSIVEDVDGGGDDAAPISRAAAPHLPSSSHAAAAAATASPLPPPMPVRPMMYALEHGGATERWDLVIQPFAAFFDAAAHITIPVFQVRLSIIYTVRMWH